MSTTLAERYDAVVIGSGAAGCWAAKELSEGGMNVLLLDAGPDHDRGETTKVDASDQKVQATTLGYVEKIAHLYANDTENPYSHPVGKPFKWVRSRQIGGRLHLWGRRVYRMSDLNFKAATRDGFGEDWPISYADLAPYYDKVEMFLGVRGNRDGVWHLPDGPFMAPAAFTPGDVKLKDTMAAKWPDRHIISARTAVGDFRWMLSAALATKRTTVRSNSVVARLVTDDDTGKVTSVVFYDRATKQEHGVNARLVFLCASPIESTRLLLNSNSRRHPGGIGHASGALGHYFMDHAYSYPVRISGIATGMKNIEHLENFGEFQTGGVCIPNFRNVNEKYSGYLRGWQTQAGIARGGWPYMTPEWPEQQAILEQASRAGYAPFWFMTEAEVLPRYENRITIDPVVKDAWGIPTAHVDLQHSENEANMAVDQVECLREMAEATGFEVLYTGTASTMPGQSTHELGGARMGSSPKTSVLNSYNQCWEARNLFVTDGSCYVTVGTQNPTLTMMALTVRACEYALREHKHRNL